MQQRKGRPPVDISEPEVEEPQYQGPQRGGLSYVGEMAPPPPRYRPQKSNQGGTMAQILMGALVAIVISVFACFQLFVPKTDIQGLTDKVNNAVNSAQANASAAVATEKARIDNIIQNYPTKADLALYALKTEVGAPVGYVKSSDFETYKTEVTTALNKKADKGGTATSPSGGTTTTGSYTVTLDKTQIISTSSTTGNADVSLTLVNNSGVGGTPTILINLIPVGYPAQSSIVASPQLSFTTSGYTTTTVPGAYSYLPGTTDVVQKLYWMNSGFYMDNGASRLVWLNFNVKATGSNVITWTLSTQVLP